MAKEKEESIQTMEDYLLSQLDKPVVLKDGQRLKDPIDGHELTKQEAIAVNILNNALKGDIRAATYIQNIQARVQQNKKKK